MPCQPVTRYGGACIPEVGESESLIWATWSYLSHLSLLEVSSTRSPGNLRSLLNVSNKPSRPCVKLNSPQGPWSVNQAFPPHPTHPWQPQKGPCSYPISQRHQGPQLDKAQQTQGSNQRHLISQTQAWGPHTGWHAPLLRETS